jgi:hypothetical protein
VVRLLDLPADLQRIKRRRGAKNGPFVHLLMVAKRAESVQ